MTQTPITILRIDSSMRREGSVTRTLTGKLVERLSAAHPAARVVERDLAGGTPLIDEGWIAANFTDPAARSEAQRTALETSDALVAELRAADVLVIGLPVYNFSVPAALKAWIDLIARARETFRYTEAGPEGLLAGKRAVIAVASGGVAVGSPVDFATPYLKHALAFVGITDVEIVSAEKLAAGAEQAIAAAEAQIARLAA
jgi:FMN-dependent NADH-azoreductase